MKFEIKNRWSGAVMLTIEGDSFRLALEAAVKNGSDLSGSDLSGSDLRDSDLRGSNLRGSDLRGSDLRDSNLRDSDLSGSDLRDSNLRDSDLRGSNLRGSNLRDSDLRDSDLRGSDLRDSDLSGSDLRDSNLRGSDLSDSNLRGSDLSGSDLSGSDLSGSNLSGSDLRGSDLQPIRDDFWAVLSAVPKEVPALIGALKAGKVDGSTYHGKCACLVGTIANARGVNYDSLGLLKPNSSRPAERFFMAIRIGDTPENNQAAALAVEWAEIWIANMHEAFGLPPIKDADAPCQSSQ
jgi:hypothetical protein